MPAKTPPATTKRIVSLRLRKRLGPVQLAAHVGVAPSTVHRVLTRCRLNRLSHVDRATGEPVRRYEHDHPGAMLHVDVKKLGNIPDGGGWRYVGRRPGRAEPGRDHRASPRTRTATRRWAPRSCTPSSTTTPASPTPRSTTTRPPSPPPPSCATRWPGSPPAASPCERVLSDNGSAYRSLLWRDVCAAARDQAHPHPALPATDQRQDRTLPPHPVRRLGLRPLLRLRERTPRRPASMAARVQPPPTPHRLREQATHHPLDQPPGSVHLVQPAIITRTSERYASSRTIEPPSRLCVERHGPPGRPQAHGARRTSSSTVDLPLIAKGGALPITV